MSDQRTCTSLWLAAAIILAASPLFADSLVTVSVSGSIAPSGSSPGCNETESSQGGGYAHANLSECFPPLAAAATGGLTAPLSGTLFLEMRQPGISQAAASSIFTQDRPFTVIGGSGGATLVLDYLMFGQASVFGEGTADQNFSVAVDGITIFSGGCPAGMDPTRFQCLDPNDPQSLQMPVTVTTPIQFGQTFDLTEIFQTTASIEGISDINLNGNVHLAGYSVLDANGNPIEGALLTTTPEPASWWAAVSGMLTIAVVFAVRGRQSSSGA